MIRRQERTILIEMEKMDVKEGKLMLNHRSFRKCETACPKTHKERGNFFASSNDSRDKTDTKKEVLMQKVR